ncbi:enoyl-CoA hydratase/isomerase family protein [Embleya hyalina]|uniref:Putative enoyl-CoA hydratase/isomerase n=1 Tax=Embleya hyalina TaxID=516124 RepID=A0A401YWT0_9ACTN|nr:enoyl-CoA hydratase-related protein [Embleya hyalina]GCD99064.1 putative enoyl-CoA hydratase/isomerase [Embleya hyalina]
MGIADDHGVDAAPVHGVDLSLTDGVAVILLCGSTPGNALDAALREELLAAVRRVRDHGSDVRAVLLAARGPSFCVGQDLKEHARDLEADPESAFAKIRAEYNPIVEALHALSQPVVAAVEGACVGAGLALALSADVRVVAEGARFATAFAGIGLAADSGLSATLTRAVGPSRTAGLFLLGDRFDARDALRWGLAHRVTPDGTAADEGLTLARRLAAGPTAAYREIKALLRQPDDAPLPTVLDREAAAQERLGPTDDHRGAVRAFLARETPTFHGS